MVFYNGDHLKEPLSNTEKIPNIDIGKAYDQRYINADIHYENVANLADFFGRNMPIHHHDRFYQIHFFLNENVHVHLDEASFSVQGPMFFLTPPTTPHAFVTDSQTTGHVITVRQETYWKLMNEIDTVHPPKSLNTPLCVELKPEINKIAEHLLSLLAFMAFEAEKFEKPYNCVHSALLQLILVDISRLSENHSPKQNTRKEDVRVFRRFNEMIESNFKQHAALHFYTEQIGVTEGRLNNICRRLTGQSSKSLITDRLMQEARRLLIFTLSPITEISYELGFKDPGYFSRFFSRSEGLSPSDYREQKLDRKPST